MRININRPPKHIRKEQARMARQEFHKKFAWKVTKVDHTDIGHRVVWFENYWRKEKIGPTSEKSKGDGHYFEKYSEKEYFKKKLNGDFDDSKFEDEVDASDIINQIQNQMNKKQKQGGGIYKRGGPDPSVKFKKYIVGEGPTEPDEKYYVNRDVSDVIESIQTFYEDDYEG